MSEQPRTDADSQDVAGVIAPPPLIYAAGLALGLAIDRIVRPPRPPRLFRRIIGLPLLAGGGALMAWGGGTMVRAGTPVRPTRPTSTLVTEGPFRYTRNPGYLGMALAYLGGTMLTGRVGALAVLPGVLATIQRGVIEREERYLERKFGSEYRRYRERVRRWL
jgi:protein-S-isoprenylcysteine O-methyltransferase Ste14